MHFLRLIAVSEVDEPGRILPETAGDCGALWVAGHLIALWVGSVGRLPIPAQR
jgi:hypothetical protein